MAMAATETRMPHSSITFGRSQENLPLVETMQLVEPRKEIPVPNHLLDSQIYTKVGQNGLLKARPSVVHFSGFQIGETHTLSLHLLNTALDIQRMHVIPPQTKYFSIKYTKQKRLMPGNRLECFVQFRPDEWRYYYDCVRIHSEAENLLIPIHAYPVMSGLDFPKQLNFAPVPIGETKTKTIPLKCNVPIDFEFQLCYLQPHPAFVVQPMTGVVPANGQQDITVTFAPTQFNTCCMELQLTISQFQARPLTCRILGSSEPFLNRDEDAKLEDHVILDPQRVSPLDIARSKRAMRKVTSSKKVQKTISDAITTGNVDTPHAVSQILLKKSGKLSIKDLRKAVRDKIEAATGQPTKQMKEAMFETAVHNEIHEERQNQLRWQVKLGGTPISDQHREDVLRNREDDMQAYKMKYGEIFMGDEYVRATTVCSFERTKRNASQVAEEVANFDTLSNNMWRVRHDMITRFQAAARKVIYRRRAANRLVLLKKLADKVKAMSIEADEADLIDIDEAKKLVSPVTLTPLSCNRIKSVTFPTYVDPTIKDDMAVDAIGAIPYMPVEITINKRVPYFNLKVPQQYQLMGYKPRCAHNDSLSYIAPSQQRTLRTGAEDEIIKVSMPVAEKLPTSLPVQSPFAEGQSAADDTEQRLLPLVPPEGMLRNMKHHPLHIFNPTPGVQVYHPPLDYSDIDNDFHLCPLPRFPGNKPWLPQMSTQKKFLDRGELITGMMTWKKFPSQGLTSLSQTPTLTNVWVPRWSDAFGSDLMPHAVPELYDGLSEEDARIIHEEMQQGDAERDADAVDKDSDEESAVLLTPEMIRAEFQLDLLTAVVPAQEKGKQSDMFPEGNQMPATNIPMSASGPVPREKREHELDYFLKKKYNKLGARIQAHIESYDGMKNDPNLVLK